MPGTPETSIHPSPSFKKNRHSLVTPPANGIRMKRLTHWAPPSIVRHTVTPVHQESYEP